MIELDNVLFLWYYSVGVFMNNMKGREVWNVEGLVPTWGDEDIVKHFSDIEIIQTMLDNPDEYKWSKHEFKALKGILDLLIRHKKGAIESPISRDFDVDMGMDKEDFVNGTIYKYRTIFFLFIRVNWKTMIYRIKF